MPSREDFWALRDVSFDIKQGEAVGVIGRNGAGKTTLLKILSRITYPAKGEVRLRGRIGSLLEVGTGFHPELTGRENIYFNGAILGMKKIEIDKKFDAIVDFSGGEKFLDTPVKRFSSGMRVRLAFSIAAHLDPEILLIDEVLAVGDVEFKKRCLGKMKDVSEGGRTVLFVSHDMSAISKICSRVLMFDRGRLTIDGETNATITRYLDQNLTRGAIVSCKELEKRKEGRVNRANPSLRAREIKILNQGNLPCNTFNSDEVIKVCITYECLTVVNDLRIAVYIVDEENRNILATQNIDNTDELNFYQKNPGIYKSFCTIQPNIFGEKHFYISVHLQYPRVEHLVFDRILGFNVVFQGYGSMSSGLKDAFIRPQMKWNTQLIDKNEEIIYE